MSEKNLHTLGDAIEQYLNAMGIGKKLKEHRLLKHWDEIAGRAIARYTDDLYIKDGVLHLHISSAVVRNEISMLRQQFITKLNEIAGERIIYDIRVH